MRRALVLALAVAATGLGAADAHAAFPGFNGRIAFVRPGEGIFSVQPDGSARLRVSPDGATCDSEPSFSASGLQLAFQTCDPARHATAIGTMTTTGLERWTLAGNSPQTPAFSPSGARIVFAAGASASTHLAVVDADGTGRRRLKAVGYAPSWSVTRRVAFTVPLNRRNWCNSTELDDVYVLGSSLKRAHRMTRNYGSYAPDWSPDGKRIAYTRDFTVGRGDAKHVHGTPMDCKPLVRKATRYGPEIVVARANGKHARRLTHTGGSDPAWSPDGKLIAFERSGWIWTMRPNGKGQRKLVHGTQPTWQPLVTPYRDPGGHQRVLARRP
jgi:Tol biopolymer transport system component